MTKITLQDTQSGYNLAQINANFDALASALNNNILWRTAVAGEDNSLQTDVDYNGHSLFNAGSLGVTRLIVNGVDITAGVQSNKIYADQAAASAITAAQQADLAYQYAQQAGTVTLPDGAVTTIKLASGAVTIDKIDPTVFNNVVPPDNSITVPKLAANAVTTVKILDQNVTTNKLADLNVTTGKLADQAVTLSKINLGSSLRQIVGNVAALRTLNPALVQIATTTGYSNSFDGGHGDWIWFPSNSVTNVANDTTGGLFVAPNSDLTGASGAWIRKEFTDGIAVNPVWFGADASGTSDSGVALANALKFSNNIKFPSGTFKFGAQINYTLTPLMSSFVMRGNGPNKTNLLFAAATNGLVLNLTSFKQCFTLEGFSFLSTQNPAGTAIFIQNTVSGADTVSRISNIFISGQDPESSNYWTNAVQIAVMNNVMIDNCDFAGRNTGVAGNGIVINGNSSDYAFNYYIDKVNMTRMANNIMLGSYWQGVYINHCGLDGTQGVYVPSGGVGVLDDLTITNTQFNCTQCVLCNSTVHDFKATGNTMFINGSGQGFAMTAGCNGSITANHMEGLIASPSQAATGIAIQNMSGGFGLAICANEIYLVNIPINLTSTTSAIAVTGNVMTSNNTSILNSGSGNLLTGNIG